MSEPVLIVGRKLNNSIMIICCHIDFFFFFSSFQQSLTVLATIPAAILILSLFFLLLYLMTKCCDRKSKKPRTFGCQKCTLIFFTVLACGAIGGGKRVQSSSKSPASIMQDRDASLIVLLHSHIAWPLTLLEQILSHFFLH